MSSQTLSAGLGENIDGTRPDWSNPTNIYTSDNSYASCYNSGIGTADPLRATNFGFTIPTGATIDGILVEVEERSSAGYNYRETLVLSGSARGTAKSDFGAWPTSDTYVSKGSSSDLWGTTWTPAQINDSTFGFQMGPYVNMTTNYVDHIRITVYYTGGGGTNGDVTAVVADAPCALIAPTVTGTKSGTVTAVLAASPCAALAPTISGTRNQTVVAVVAASPASALAPAVTGTRNQTVTAVIATSPCAALAPSVSATRNQTVTAVIATSPASALAPSVTGTINISVTAVVASSPAQALAPSVTGTRNQTVTAVTATAVTAMLAPAVTGTRSQTKSPTTIAQTDDYGPVAWADLENIISSNDLYATTHAEGITPSETILSTGYGFTIPAGSTIAGITVSVERKAVGTYGADLSAKLIKGGAISGDEKSTSAIIPAADEYITFGADGSLWGNTLEVSDVNAADFGFAYSAFVYGSTISVDHIRITVFYLGDGIIGDVTAVPASAPAAMLAPSVSGSVIVNGSVTAVIANSQAAALAPTVSGICNGSIVAVIAAAPASAIAPTVTGIANGSVSAVTANTPAAMLAPAVSGICNGSITAVIAVALASMPAPVVSGIVVINGAVTATIAICQAAAFAPTVSAEINGYVTADTSTCTASFLPPGVYGTQSATITGVTAGCVAVANAPDFVGQLFTEYYNLYACMNMTVTDSIVMNRNVTEGVAMTRTVSDTAEMNRNISETVGMTRTVSDNYSELEKT